jgi:prephenate dehydrogenase
MRVRRLSILGLGLLGGSLGLAAKRSISDCTVAGYAHRRETLDAALATAAVDEGFMDPAAAVKGADLVVLCTPVLMLSPLLGQIAAFLADDAVVTDVGSTKRSIVQAGEATLTGNTHFVGSHPMAGSEKRGIQFARADLFDGAVCITTPTPKTNPAALEKVEQFWKTLGMRLTRIGPDRHDELLADVSHLPHAVAGALVAMQDEQSLGICGKGFLDLTRIAGGDAGLWRDILLDNRDAIRQSIARLTGRLSGLDDLLKAGDSDAIKKWLETASARRKAITERRQSDESNG